MLQLMLKFFLCSVYIKLHFIVIGTISATTEAQNNGVLWAEGKASRVAEKDTELQHAQ